MRHFNDLQCFSCERGMNGSFLLVHADGCGFTLLSAQFAGLSGWGFSKHLRVSSEIRSGCMRSTTAKEEGSFCTALGLRLCVPCMATCCERLMCLLRAVRYTRLLGHLCFGSHAGAHSIASSIACGDSFLLGQHIRFRRHFGQHFISF